MNKMSLPGSSAGVRRCAQHFAHSFSHNAGLTSIRFATVLGCLCAFVLLCTLSLRANAAPLVDGTPRVALHVDDSRPATALPARDAMGQTVNSAADIRSSDEAVSSAPFLLAPSGHGHSVGQAVSGTHDAAIERQTWLLALAAPAVVALAGACLSHAALKRVAEKQQYAEGEWKRRCDAAEAREQAARVATLAHTSVAARQDRPWLPCMVRLYAEAPLIAVAGLLESLETASTPSTQRAQMQVIRSAVRTWSQTLRDLLDASPLEARAFVLDESTTNLRELVDGVIALLSPSAAQRGLHLNSSIDQTVAEWILADSARLGQIFFHLLSRTVQLSTRGEITLFVRAEPLNSGSQRIFISVANVGAEGAQSAQLQLFGPSADDPLGDGWLGDADVCLPLCQILTQRMQGELSVASGSGPGSRASFSAPVTVDQWQPGAGPTSHTQAPLFADVAQSQDAATSVLLEPFERRYLDALSEEGIDIHTFLGGWRHSMDDDLKRLSEVSHNRDHDRQSSLLHRLSGAVGLVGAHSLMDALQRASAASQELDATAIDALAGRARVLITQLDAEIAPYRSITR